LARLLELPSQSSPFTNLTRNYISSWRTPDKPPLFKITGNGWKNRWEFNILKIGKYTKLRYQDWLFAVEEDPGEKSFIILWVPKAMEAIKDPNKDTNHRAQLLKDWTKTKEKQKESPIP